MNRRKFLRIGIPVVSASVVSTKLVFATKKNNETDGWYVETFFDKGLAQYTYAILYDKKIILVDPARDPQPFYDYAKNQNATIVGVIETHPHADFISSHTEIKRKTGSTIYVSEKLNAKYKHHGVKDGDILPLNDNINLRILETPGHSPDSISIVLQDHNIDQVVFTGDALLFGDVGRPDLREYGNHENEQRTFLAKQLYHTVHEKFATLNDSLVVYPAHGAGSLCGNATHNVTSSTIGYEKAHNHAFQHPTEKAFVDYLLSSLSFVPQYFPYDVELNRVGSNDVKTNLDKVKIFSPNYKVPVESIVVDIRPKNIYSKSYFKNAINIQEGTKFETWFGTVINPNQKFFLVGQDADAIHLSIAKLSKIGYETHLNGAFTFDIPNTIPSFLDGKKFILPDQQQYTIIDVRNANEFNEKKLISSSVNIPLPDLAKGKIQIPKGKPIVVHCASGYRSAIAASILRNEYPDLQILDLGEEITNIQNASTK